MTKQLEPRPTDTESPPCGLADTEYEPEKVWACNGYMKRSPLPGQPCRPVYTDLDTLLSLQDSYTIVKELTVPEACMHARAAGARILHLIGPGGSIVASWAV